MLINLDVYGSTPDFSPMGLLASHCETLLEVDISGHTVVVAEPLSSGGHTQYPQVCKLTWYFVGFCHVSALFHSFPALRNLQFKVEPHEPFKSFSSETQDRYRAMNLASQTGDCHWHSLDFLGGRVEHLYMLAARTPVTHLCLASVNHEADHLIPVILATSTLQLLTVDATFSRMNSLSAVGGLLALLKNVAGSVTALNLDIWFHGELEVHTVVVRMDGYLITVLLS